MFITALIFQMSTAAVTPDLLDRVRTRTERLDQLVIHLTKETYTVSAEKDPLDSANWDKWEVSHPHVLRVVRPNVENQNLLDDPDRGYEPVIESIVDGVYTSRHVRPYFSPRLRGYSAGSTTFSVVSRRPDMAGSFAFSPLLQLCELNAHVSYIPGVTLIGFLKRPDLRSVGSVGGMHTFAADLDNAGQSIESHLLTISSTGLPVRWRVTTRFAAPPEKSLPHSVREYNVLRTMEVNGAELPAEVAFVSRRWMPHWTVTHLTVSQAAHDPSLKTEDLRIVPVERSSAIHVYRDDGVTEHRYYDDEGTLWQTIESLGPTPIHEGDVIISRDSLGGRFWLAIAALTTGLAASLTLALVSRSRPVA